MHLSAQNGYVLSQSCKRRTLGPFSIVTEPENDKLKNASFRFVKMTLTDLELEAALEDILDENIGIGLSPHIS